MSSIRLKRMEKELFKLISNVLTLRLNDPHLAHVTITAVKLTTDFSLAKIYYTFIDDVADEVVNKTLTKTAGFFKNEIAKAKIIRTIPELQFFYDEVEENATKLDEIFKKIREEE